ncbi:E3 ubiquitin-protein ligase RNF14 [Anabrus simplex]|uniref:E3 ubiquitin-protein ligase RNF14 n=1 Tax=Anabrus simplex TaxID=316456 RepID=UPI0035A28849
MSDKETQQDELCALESIYTNEELQLSEENGKSGGQFRAHITLSSDFKITFADIRLREKSEVQELTVEFLPPLMLYFSLPEDYPSVSPPNFTLSCPWLRRDNIAKLCRRLDEIWDENKGMEILFMWTEFLKEESLRYLNIDDKLDISKQHTFYLRYIEYLKRKRSQGCARTSSELQGTDSNRGRSGPTRGGRRGRPHPSLEKKAEGDAASEEIKGAPMTHKDERAVLDLSPEVSLVQLLQDYNEERKKTMFDRNFYACKICFTDKRGEQCTRFEPCGHVFCRECMSGYLEVRIKEGTVQSIGCPEDKCTSEASPSQVKDLVSAELFSKYDSVLLNATLETMEDILYCPRSSCNYPVSREPNEKMATCPACHYVFCIYCKMVYHGVEPCRFKSAEKRQLVEEYQNASLQRRAELEQRYGRKQLQTLVDTHMSESWINENSKNCPHCNAAIEKSDGCNKMVCWRCNTYFCWICSARLNPQCPYEHFNSTKSQCFNKLFLGVPMDDMYNDRGIFLLGDDDPDD